MAKAKASKVVEAGDESPRDKFVRLAEARMSKAITAIQQLAHLSNPAYQYDDADLKKMQEAFQRQLSATFQTLKQRPKGAVKQRSFSLE